MSRHVGEVAEQDHGLWSVPIWPGHAEELLTCLDPHAPFVVIDCGNPSLGWHVAHVSIHDEPAQPRTVRNLSFTLRVEPSEAAQLGPLVRASHDGSLRCVQSTKAPVAFADLPAHPAGRAAVMKRHGVVLAVNLPHDGQVAVVAGPLVGLLRDFVRRYREQGYLD